MEPKRVKLKLLRRLKVGDTAPAFWTRDINGKAVDSAKFRGNTLLVFLRYAGCPLCNMAIYRLSHEYKLLKKNGCEVVAFVQSTEDNIEKNIIARQTTSPPFQIIADQEQDFYKLYGVAPSVLKTAGHIVKNGTSWIDASLKKGFPQAELDGSLFMVPAFFLLDKNSTILTVNYDSSFYDDKTFTTIYELLNFGAPQS